jgi:NADH:ubiquinone oxidoreductase subunit 3 (subunit A)
VVFQKMAWGGLEALVGFLGVLAIGWFYLLKRGALDWE